MNDKDGLVLVYVPGGKYVLGEDDIDVNDDSRPLHTVELSPFWIGKYPVTNEQYARFLKATGHREPKYWRNERFDDPRQPVVGVSWRDALAYCEWAGLELLTEARWEAAARGTDQRRYPWGHEEPARELANFAANEGRPTPVGAYPQGAGPFGTLDQTGNVWEWCHDLWNSDAYTRRNDKHDRDPVESGREDDEKALRVVRGGSWRNPSRILRAAFRTGRQAGFRDSYLGFRVCRSISKHSD